jgi:hypothetical protein
VASPAARKLISFSTGAATKVFQLLDKPGLLFQNLRNQLEVKTQIELVSKDTSPLIFTARIRSASFPEKPFNFWWSWRRELNPRPSDYKSDALPAELRQHAQTG